MTSTTTTTHTVQRYEDGFTLNRPAVEFSSREAADEYVNSRTDRGRRNGVTTYYIVTEV